ncbi:MAG: GAF domain-containing protein [Anaerolineales bacterium]|nr:GAF domain-containing protein [Anaerolineales bacterium]
MKVIRDISLRYKLLFVFVLLALLSVAGLFTLRQFIVKQFAEDVLPTQAVVSQFGHLVRDVQAEALEYVALGSDETLQQFETTSAELSSVADELTTLGDDEGEEDALVAANSVGKAIVAGSQAVIDSHSETLDLLDTLEDIEAQKETVLAGIDRESLLANLDLRAEIIALNQVVVLAERLHTETLEYTLTGEESTLEDLQGTRAELLVVLASVRANLADTTLDQSFNVQPALDVLVELMSLSEQIVTNHTDTLELLENLETLEGQAEQARSDLLDLVQEDAQLLVRQTDTGMWAAGIFGQVIFILLGLLIARAVVRPLFQLNAAAEKLGAGEYDTRLTVEANDEIGHLMHAFNGMAEQMKSAVADLEQHSQAIETSAEVSHRLSTILNVEELTTAVVELLKVQFNYYHAHIYLFDDARENLVMVGGTGVAGEALLSSGHKIAAGKGLVGRTAANNAPSLVPDVTLDANWLPNPLLPDTRAEVAVPITLEGEVLGVLDVQNREPGSLGADDVELLQSVAWQVAIGLQNAHLFEQVQEEKAQVQGILDSLSLPIIISRVSDGLVTYINNSFSQAAMLSREEVVGQVTPDFYADPAARMAILTKLQTEGRVSDFEAVLKRGNGEHFWALLSAGIIVYEGEPAILASVLDIDNRKEAEARLAKNASELEIVAQVSTVAATILEPQEMLQQVTDLTKSSFQLYHAHIHLLDESGETLVLTAGAGEVGRQMVAEGRRIPLVAAGSLVATVARTLKGAIRNYEGAGEGFMPHPLLEDTRSEMAVPIAVGGQVLGVLDVRSDKLNYFGESDLQTVTSLAAQVAVALQNARSYARSEEAFKDLQVLSRRLTREGWEDYLTEQPELAYNYDLQAAKPLLNGHGAAETAVADSPALLLAKPLQIQGQPIGELAVTGLSREDEETADIIAAVAERLSAHLENLRLAEQSEKDRAAAEKRSEEIALINQLVTQISSSLDLQHSLQIIVDELAVAVNVDQVRIALLEKERNELVVIAEHYDSTKAPSAVGMVIPIEGNELTQTVIKTREMVVIEDAQNAPETAPVHDLFAAQGIETVILMPLVVNDEVLGTIGLDILDKRPVRRASLQLAQTIVYQTATAIQNARLFEQTQAALAETELLYAHSSQLNTATNLDAVLDSAAAPGFQAGATDALLFVYDQDTIGQARQGQFLACSPRNIVPLGQKFALDEQPFARFWPADGKNVLLVGDVSEDKRLNAQDKQMFLKAGIQAVAIMYLSVVNLRLGQIVIRWHNRQTFTSVDERLYGAIAQQASSVVYNRLLFNQTEEALSETAALYQASADINTAQTYDQVLTALRQHTALGQGSHSVTINFFDRPWDKDQIPEEVFLLANWGEAEAVQPARFRVDTIPGFLDLINSDEMLVHSDVATDERISDEFREVLLKMMNVKAAVYVPLTIGNRRVGYINGYYGRPKSFTDEQLRRLNVLVSQAAVSIQSLQLLEQTRRRADREALINNINKKIQSAPTVQFALQTAVAELSQALKLKTAVVELSLAEEENGHQQELPSRSAEPA